MARPKDSPLQRLSRRVWIRALRTSFDEKLAEPIESDENNWTEFSQQLLAFSDHPKYAAFRFQGLLGVVNEGNDPRLIIRRIPELETDGIVPDGISIVNRLPPGPTNKDPKADAEQPISYLEFPVDLVECGEKMCPESGHWEVAYLWRLAMPQLPRLEELRMHISRLKTRLGIYSPSIDEYRSYLSTEQFSEREYLSEAQNESRYRQSLEPLIAAKSANAMSLLAALVAESFMTDQEHMLNIHRDAFNMASKDLLANEHFEDIKQDFYKMVTARILTMGWQMPMAYHVSSINSPFITIDSWKKITGIDNWTSIWDP